MESVINTVDKFITILYKTNPGLINNCQYSISVDRPTIRNFRDEIVSLNLSYQLRFEFPQQYRDQVLTISKFCGINFEHEFWTEHKTIFETTIV
jgi:hypothetical protein